MLQIASLIGAALILLAFVGAQTERMTPRDRSYNLLNALGDAEPAAQPGAQPPR